MKGYFKGLVSGVLITTLLFSGIGFAAVKTQKIDAFVNSVKLSINGNFVSSENIIYKSTLYVPAKKIAENLGKTFNWDKAKNIASFTDPIATSKYNMQNPAPLNTPQVFSINDIMDNYKVEIAVTEIVKGDDAWSRIIAENQFNTEPPAGKMYILAKIKVKALDISGDKSLKISAFNFTAFSGTNKKLENPFTVAPDFLNADLYKNATDEGWASFLVDSDDASPKIVYGRNYDGSGGIWFSLK